MFKGTFARRVPNAPNNHPAFEARGRMENNSIVFDLYRYGELHYPNIEKENPPSGVTPNRWVWLRNVGFQTFVGVERRGRYKGKSWDERDKTTYKDVLTQMEQAEVILGQQYYDSLVGAETRILLTQTMC